MTPTPDFKSPVTYVPGFLSVEEADDAFARLMIEIEWEDRPDAPRREIWMNPLGTPYTYGRGAGERTYDPNPYNDIVKAVSDKLVGLGISLDACFLNRYEDERQHLGWHADDSPEIDDARSIAVISLGVERMIFAKEKGSSSFEWFTLGHGSLFVMHPGMQSTHDHKIPKHSAKCGPRISLTYRGLLL